MLAATLRRHASALGIALAILCCAVSVTVSQLVDDKIPDSVEDPLDHVYTYRCGEVASDRSYASVGFDVTSVRVLLIERALADLGPTRAVAVDTVAAVLRHDGDLNTRAGAVLALAILADSAAPLPQLSPPSPPTRPRTRASGRWPATPWGQSAPPAGDRTAAWFRGDDRERKDRCRVRNPLFSTGQRRALGCGRFPLPAAVLANRANSVGMNVRT